MKKLKILIVPSDNQGVGHFRSIWPAQSIQENFRDEVEIEIGIEVEVDNFNQKIKERGRQYFFIEKYFLTALDLA